MIASKLQLVVGAALALVVFTTSSEALNITWGSAGGKVNSLFDTSGVLSGGSYQLELILDSGNNTVLSDMITAGQFAIGSEVMYGGSYNGALVSDDSIVATESWTLDGAGAYAAGSPFLGGYIDFADSTPVANNNDNFYFRWFNTSDGIAGSEVGIIYDSTWQTASSDTANPQASANVDYAAISGTTGGTQNGASGWATVAPVPEPGSMVLFALGLVTLAVRKRRR